MIVRTRDRGNVELRSFALTDMVRWGYSGLRNLQPRLSEAEMRGIPAIARAARFRAQELGKLQLYCWQGRGPRRERIETVWQARLFRNSPNDVQTRFGFWETVEESLCYRGNAYIWKNVDPLTRKIVDWWALHPDQVERLAVDRWRITIAKGYVDPVGQGNGTYDVDSSTILHVRGHGAGGELVAPSPVEQFRDAMAGPVGRLRHEARRWRRGTDVQVAIEFPAGVSKERADQWREMWRSNMEGTEGETTAVIGDGATIKPIGLSPADAQFVEGMQLTLVDAALIMGVSVHLLGVTGAVGRESKVDLVQERQNWLQNEWAGELQRIEDHLYGDAQLFGQAALLRSDASGSLGLYPAFDTDGFVRGDLVTEATIIQTDVQAGILTPNEARHIKGYPPDTDPNSDRLQPVPVGGSPHNVPQTGNSNAQPDDGAAE